MYLIDTVVLSELRKPQRHAGITRWLHDKAADELFLSAISVGEVVLGVARQRIRNPAFSETLAAWLDRTIDTYGDRVLPVTTGVARRWGQLCARIGHGGADLLIAATALEHGLSVVTRNVRHFSPTSVSIENPSTDAE